MIEHKRRKRGAVVQKVVLRARTAGLVFEGVELRLVKRNSREEHADIPGVPYNSKLYYKIEVDHLGTGRRRVEIDLNLTHADPNELVKKAEAIIDEFLAISWTNVLYVTVERPRFDGEQTAGFRFKWRPFQTGKRGGDSVYRETPTEHHRTHIYPGALKVGADAGDFHDERVTHAVVPDTEMNRSRLMQIAEAVNLLRERLAELLTPKQIENTLSNIALLQLPATSADTEGTKPTKRKPSKRKAKKTARGRLRRPQ